MFNCTHKSRGISQGLAQLFYCNVLKELLQYSAAVIQWKTWYKEFHKVRRTVMTSRVKDVYEPESSRPTRYEEHRIFKDGMINLINILSQMTGESKEALKAQAHFNEFGVSAWIDVGSDAPQVEAIHNMITKAWQLFDDHKGYMDPALIKEKIESLNTHLERLENYGFSFQHIPPPIPRLSLTLMAVLTAVS